MYGDVFSNRGKDSVHVSPGSGSGPSPLLTRLLLQNPSDDEGDGSGAGSRAGSVALDPSDLAARSGSPGIVSDDERGGWPLGASARAPRSLAAEALSLDVTVRPSLSRTASGLFRDQPLVGARPRARYAFDPWTKVPVVIHPPPPTPAELAALRARPWHERVGLRWCWRLEDPSWWVAFCYLVGSVGFAVGGFASCVRVVVDAPTLFLRWEVMPYVVGGVHFLVASVLLVYTSYDARYGEPGRADRRRVARKHPFLGREEWTLRAAVGEAGTVGVDPATQPMRDEERSELHALSDAMEEARRLWLQNDSWTRRRRALELVSAALILAGVVLYKVMVFTMLARCLFPRMPWSPAREAALYFYPCLVGSLLFVAGSYVLWCASNRSWSPPFWPTSTSTWIAWLSVVGSACYLLGSVWVPPSIATRVARGPALEWAAPGWPTLFVGFGVGSLVFLAQAALMIHEIAVANDDKEEGVVGGARVVVARRTRRGEVLEGVV